MSWAEIKKAVNSNLDVPLNRLITQNGNIRVAYDIGTTQDPNRVILNIQNAKGCLLSAIMYCTATASFNFKVEIDEKINLHLLFVKQSSNNVYCGITNKDFIVRGDNPTSGSRVFYGYYQSLTATQNGIGCTPQIYQYDYRDDTSGSEWVFNNDSVSLLGKIVAKPIQFENSLKITCGSNASNQHPCGVAYELLE